jgi:crotonobetainyl-CoA:carnitine CoA-transferase CaiB-like acyl-CoA transferase
MAEAQALAGIRVAELATGVAGPYCGKLLAGLGTDVLKIEPPGGDPSRLAGPFPGDLPDIERSGLFLHLNTSKRSATLDMDAPGAVETLEGYLAAEQTDVLILDMQREDLRRAGIDLDQLHARLPRLVIADVTTFGLSGPYADYRGGELIAYALSGYMTLTGAADREPIKSYGNLVEYEAGAHAAVGVMAALFAREATGRGQVVDVSVMEAGTFLLGAVEQLAHFYGRIERRNGTRLLGFGPEHSYPSTIRPCKDGYVHAHSNNRYLDLLGALVPHPRLLDPDVLAAMMAHADEIDAIMDEWLADKTRDEIVQAAQELRLPFTEVMTPGEVMADPNHRERGSFVEVEHPGAGRVLQPGPPFRMHGTPWRMGPAPMLGAPLSGERAATTSPASRTVTGTSGGVNARPLDGVRVIDFTNAVAGPIATFILADLGADVIKVESPSGRPLHAKGTAPVREGGQDISYNRMMTFNELNHGKRGISLDVARAEGRELFLRLVAAADVVVENFAPHVMGNLGLSYAALKEANPSIVLVSMPAFGLSGGYSARRAYGPGVDAMSGLSHLTGYEDGPPMKPGNFFCDQNAGVHTAFATLAALWHRRRTHEGQLVEMPMIDGEFQVLGDAYIDYAMNGSERMRSGNGHPAMAPHDVFRCAGEDAWVAIAVESEAQWAALARMVGGRALADDMRFATAAARRENRAELHETITAWTSNRDHYAVQDILQAAGVPAGAVLNSRELLADPHVVARHGFEYVDVPDVGPTPYPRVAFRLSGTPVPITKAAPGFAEDNDAVYKGMLGLSADKLAELEAKLIVSRVPVEPAGR